jgi:hypothetical protein
VSEKATLHESSYSTYSLSSKHVSPYHTVNQGGSYTKRFQALKGGKEREKRKHTHKKSVSASMSGTWAVIPIAATM